MGSVNAKAHGFFNLNLIERKVIFSVIEVRQENLCLNRGIYEIKIICWILHIDLADHERPIIVSEFNNY